MSQNTVRHTETGVCHVVGECGAVKSGDVGKGTCMLYKNEYTSISLLTQLIY
jgi:hypothetical protein